VHNISKGIGDAAMNKAGWLDLWHLALTTVASQPPFMQIAIVTGLAYVLVMALEGTRTSIFAIWRGHRTPPPALPVRPVAQAAPASVAAPSPAAAPPSRSFAAKSSPRTAPARRPKAAALAPRQFRAPRPKIRRQTLADAVSAVEMPDLVASAELTEAV
jgi:hypothetical protein